MSSIKPKLKFKNVSATGFLSTSEVYTSSGWQTTNALLPEGIYESCAVTLNSTSVMLIGGHTDSQVNFYRPTLLLKC